MRVRLGGQQRAGEEGGGQPRGRAALAAVEEGGRAQCGWQRRRLTRLQRAWAHQRLERRARARLCMCMSGLSISGHGRVCMEVVWKLLGFWAVHGGSAPMGFPAVRAHGMHEACAHACLGAQKRPSWHRCRES